MKGISSNNGSKRIRKVAVFVLLFLLVFPHASVLGESMPAESATQAELLFRGMPWMIDANELAERYFSEFNLEPNTWPDFAMPYTWGSENVNINNAGILMGSNNRVSGNVYVAGHAIKGINVYAMYGIVDGKISKEASDARYYRAQYIFSVNDDISEVFDDLLGKLTETYGEPVDAGSATIFDAGYMWEGANSTGIYLTRQGEGYLNLIYTKTDADKMLNEVKRVLLNISPDSKDGL